MNDQIRSLQFAYVALLMSVLASSGCGGGGGTNSSGLGQQSQQSTFAITTGGLPAGNVGTEYDAAINSNSTSPGSTPVVWSVSSGLPPGLTLPPQGAICGTDCAVGGTPTVKGTFNFTATAKDASGASASKAFSITIGSPQPLAVITTTADLSPVNGTVNRAYGPATLSATGGLQPYKWTLAAGSSLPNNLTMDSSGNLSGTPSEFGTFSFKVMVSDAETPALTATANLSITIHTLLFGQYSFLFNGFDANGAVAAAGSFTSDGMGNISSGLEDFNRHVAGPITNATVTGKYSIGPDNRGTLTLNSSVGVSTYAFALNPVGFNGRLIEFDSTGTRGSGVFQAIGNGESGGTTTGGAGFNCTSNSFSIINPPEFSFGISGDDSNKGRVAIAGRFHADTAGNLSSGILDENDAGVVSSNVAWTGSYAVANPPSPRCDVTVTPAGSSNLKFAYYPPFLVEVDSLATGIPLTSGRVLPQSVTGLTNASLKAPMLGGVTGFSGTANAPDVSLVFFSPDGNGNFTITQDENKGGIVSTGTVVAGTYDVASNGRVTLTAGNTSQVLYLGGGFIIGTDNSVMSGVLLQQQTGSIAASNSTIKGGFTLGTAAPASANVADFSGVISADGVGTASGSLDESTSIANSTGASITGGYSITNTPMNGEGTFTITHAGGQTDNFIGGEIIDSHTSCAFHHCFTSLDGIRIVAIPTDSTQTDPAVLILDRPNFSPLLPE